MSSHVDRLVTVGKAMARGAQSDRITFIAASLAYYAFISLIPLLLLALVATAAFGGPEVIETVDDELTSSLGPDAAALVVEALTTNGGRSGVTLVGVVVLLWSGLKLFRGLDVAFAEVYRTGDPGSFVDQLRDALVALGAVGGGIAVTVAVGALITRSGLRGVAEGVDVIGVVGTVGLLGSLVVAFLPLYYVFPDRQMTVRQALPGAVLAAVGWTALQTLFRLYAMRAGGAYGVLGGALLLLTWLYFGSLILLLGVVLNAVLDGRIDPDRELDEQTGPERPRADTTALGIMGEIDTDIDELDDEELQDELRRLRDEVASFEERVQERTVHREEIESDLRRYVRRQVRRGKARGWGPYLVLLYGTLMTLGAFYYLSGGWAILAMLVLWLSTLGLYVLMVLVGAAVGVAGLPGRLGDRLRSLRE